MHQETKNQTFFFIRSNGKYVRVAYSDILYIFSRQNYVQVVAKDKNYVILNTLKQLEDALPEDQFCRIHRSFIVSLDQVTAFDRERVFLGDKEFPLRDHYREALQQKVNILYNEIRERKTKGVLDETPSDLFLR